MYMQAGKTRERSEERSSIHWGCGASAPPTSAQSKAAESAAREPSREAAPTRHPTAIAAAAKPAAVAPPPTACLGGKHVGKQVVLIHASKPTVCGATKAAAAHAVLGIALVDFLRVRSRKQDEWEPAHASGASHSKQDSQRAYAWASCQNTLRKHFRNWPP